MFIYKKSILFTILTQVVVLVLFSFSLAYLIDLSTKIKCYACMILLALHCFLYVSLFINVKILRKITYIILILSCLFVFTVYLIENFGVFNSINSVEELRIFVKSFGDLSIFIYIIVQILQVTVLPVPSIIIMSVGVLLFGPFLGAVCGSFGIIIGSIISYFFGRIFGYKFVCWLIGKSRIDRIIKILKGKGEMFFTFMFLFPFFPDDLLCVVAGVGKVKAKFFITMIIIVRFITTFISAYTINNSLIPYNSWWGILLYLCFFLITIYLAINILKNDKFFFNKLFTKR